MDRLICTSCGALLPLPGARCQTCSWPFERIDHKQLRAGLALMLLALCIGVGIAVAAFYLEPL